MLEAIHTQTTNFPFPKSMYTRSIYFHDGHFSCIKKDQEKRLKSGVITSKSTRTLPNNLTVQWQIFTDAYRWDQQNSLQLHRKLTNDIFFLIHNKKTEEPLGGRHTEQRCVEFDENLQCLMVL